ncbi:MAG: aminotransferase class V-fold PLP-dependent enzyme [Vicinamibacterales bacterium]
MTTVQRFLDSHPDYAATSTLDQLRTSEYGRLDTQRIVYLDYTGGGLHAESQVRQHASLLAQSVFGNPHSASPSSTAMTDAVERARAMVLEYFNGTGDYTAVFTLNASGALKLVGEAFPFEPGGRLLLTVDNHNSVNGIREFARRGGAAIDYTPLTTPDLRLDLPGVRSRLANADPARANLFAFPAQSNFSGVKHPLSLVEEASECGWHVLLDAAAFVPTNRLDLRLISPDFVAVSFYKMFGYPTGVGCLLIRNAALATLRRPWFAGGTVNFATVQGRGHVLAPREAGFEDGTLNYLSIPAVEIGLRHLERTGIDTLQRRLGCLTEWLLAELHGLHHGNGQPVVRVYGPSTGQERGATVSMNFYDPAGTLLDFRRIEELAGHDGISLRTGCFCNPGAGEIAGELTEEDMRAGLAEGADLTLPRFLQLMHQRGAKTLGAIRVSLGVATNIADVDRFLQFAAGFRDRTLAAVGALTVDDANCRVIRDGS